MLVPRSLTSDYAFVSSLDPALDAPPPDATDDERERWAHKITVARESGNYAEVLKKDHRPTLFRLRTVDGPTWRRLIDRIGSLGHATAFALVVRAALRSVENLGDARVTHRDEPDVGSIADESIIATLDSVDPAVVNELATHVIEHQNRVPKKS
jgi:hypothetical protein